MVVVVLLLLLLVVLLVLMLMLWKGEASICITNDDSSNCVPLKGSGPKGCVLELPASFCLQSMVIDKLSLKKQRGYLVYIENHYRLLFDDCTSYWFSRHFSAQ